MDWFVYVCVYWLQPIINHFTNPVVYLQAVSLERHFSEVIEVPRRVKSYGTRGLCSLGLQFSREQSLLRVTIEKSVSLVKLN